MLSTLKAQSNKGNKSERKEFFGRGVYVYGIDGGDGSMGSSLSPNLSLVHIKYAQLIICK